ncbi:gp83 [Sphingomonas phage PAU]|uniref:gp83 n=1 Tax=Sphingomonas phage PAU TaxID=1150991 RepID=UPI00025731DD|nr:gp83 [Sphingomonas phage PAU]AFF28081.1 gp83 [Sphingomonas phage PAU]
MQRTIIVDGNFMLMRIFSVLNFEGTFMTVKRPEESDMQFNARRNKDINEFIKNLCRHFAKTVQRYSYCDKIIIAKDAKSWRKDMSIPQPKNYTLDGFTEGDDTDYKGNRVKDDKVDWSVVYSTFEDFAQTLESDFNVPYAKVNGAEGDDWLWYLPRYLYKNKKIHSLLYCSDGDISHTIKDYTIIARQVKTKIGPQGELLTTKKLNEVFDATKNATIFNVNHSESDHLTEMFKEVSTGLVHHIVPNPASHLVWKLLIGDAKDNIPCTVAYTKNGKQWKRPNHTFFCKFLDFKGIGLESDHENPLTFEHLYDEKFIREFYQDWFAPSMKKAINQDMDIDHAVGIYKNNLKMLHLSKEQIPEYVYDGMQKTIESKLDILDKCDTKLMTNGNVLINSINKGAAVNDFFNMFNLDKTENTVETPEACVPDASIFDELGID